MLASVSGGGPERLKHDEDAKQQAGAHKVRMIASLNEKRGVPVQLQNCLDSGQGRGLRTVMRRSSAHFVKASWPHQASAAGDSFRTFVITLGLTAQ